MGFLRVKGRKYDNAMAGGSKLEEAVYQILLLREKAGEIRELRRQQVLILQDGPRETRITWRIDFGFEEKIRAPAHELQREGDWIPSFAEAKGFADEVYKLKLKLFRGRPQGKLEIWGGNYKNPRLMEVIHP